jgi:hypothetical protein
MVGGRKESLGMIVPATLFVVRDGVPSSMIAESIDDAIRVAVAGEDAGDFKAVEITDWSARRLDQSALRDAITRRRASQP